jgi:hypothetical protein
VKRKRKFKCDDLARSIVERNLRGFIRKSGHSEDAADLGGDGVDATANVALADLHPSDTRAASKEEKP